MSNERIIGTLSAVLDDGREVQQGQSVELSQEEEARLDASACLVPAVFESFEEFSRFKLDAYRAGRGDSEAAARVSQAAMKGFFDARQAQLLGTVHQGGIEDLENPENNEFVQILRETSPNIDATIALARGLPDLAVGVLEAERIVTGGEPRKGVENGLADLVAQAAPAAA